MRVAKESINFLVIKMKILIQKISIKYFEIRKVNLREKKKRNKQKQWGFQNLFPKQLHNYSSKILAECIGEWTMVYNYQINHNRVWCLFACNPFLHIWTNIKKKFSCFTNDSRINYESKIYIAIISCIF